MSKPQCDLVMKGGITSGVVYPRAIYELSKTYQFKNIAGTSAGAIAAVMAAAAQYGENEHQDGHSFESLEKMPNELGGPADKGRGTKMLELFQPTPSMASIYDLAMEVIRLKEIFKTRRGRIKFWSRLAAWWQALGSLLRVSSVFVFRFGMWPITLSLPGLGLLAGVFVAEGAFTGVRVLAYLSAVMVAVVGFAAGAVLGVVGRAKRITRSENMFGICTALEQPSGKGAPALTNWMHARIQDLAGRGVDGSPLTFGELEKRDINLKTMTTCITHGRPYLLPFSKGSFFFSPAEFRRLLPGEVVDYLEARAREILREQAGNARFLLAAAQVCPKLPLPRDKDLPVLLAARMSLSFPVLLSAVPLWSFDFRRDEVHGARKAWFEWKKTPDGKVWFEKLSEHAASDHKWMDGLDPGPTGSPRQRMKIEKVWFSDGGICSNFPVHLFDQLIPKWPTFAINLRYHETTLPAEDRVHLAQSHKGEKEPYWRRMGAGDGDSEGSIAGFLGGILSTMMDWADNTLMVVPGYPDRIVHVNLQKDEGGLNLEMTPGQIEDLGKWGEEAASQLVERFTNPNPEKGDLSWDNHRWTRLRSTLGVLQKKLQGLREALNHPGPESARTYEQLLDRKRDEHPTSYAWASPTKQTPLAKKTLASIDALLDEIEDGYKDGFRDRNIPKDEPELQLRPPL